MSLQMETRNDHRRRAMDCLSGVQHKYNNNRHYHHFDGHHQVRHNPDDHRHNNRHRHHDRLYRNNDHRHQRNHYQVNTNYSYGGLVLLVVILIQYLHNPVHSDLVLSTSTTVPFVVANNSSTIELNPNTVDLNDDDDDDDDGGERQLPTIGSTSTITSVIEDNTNSGSFVSSSLSEKPIVKFELLEDDTPKSNQTKLPAYASWTSPSSSSLPKPIGLTGTKQGKRFFRKKVTTTYEYSNKRKPIPSALADPNKSYFKFKFSPKDEPTSVSRQQQPRSRLQFLKDLVINKKIRFTANNYYI